MLPNVPQDNLLSARVMQTHGKVIFKSRFRGSCHLSKPKHETYLVIKIKYSVSSKISFHFSGEIRSITNRRGHGTEVKGGIHGASAGDCALHR